MSRYPVKWLRRMRRLSENGYMKPPSLYNFIISLPELSESTRIQSPTPHSYPEDDYIGAIYEKYPEVKTKHRREGINRILENDLDQN
eukprot:g8742.t1